MVLSLINFLRVSWDRTPFFRLEWRGGGGGGEGKKDMRNTTEEGKPEKATRPKGAVLQRDKRVQLGVPLRGPGDLDLVAGEDWGRILFGLGSRFLRAAFDLGGWRCSSLLASIWMGPLLATLFRLGLWLNR